MSILTKVRKDKKDRYVEEYVPYVDILEADNDYVLRADMPGVSKEGVDINIDDELLSIEGRVRDEFVGEYPRVYKRRFRLDTASVDREKIKASIENGVLTLNVPKSESVKAKKIKISLS